METFILAFIIVVLAIIGLAAGSLLGRSPVKGSCGGLACHKGVDCGACNARHRKDPQ